MYQIQASGFDTVIDELMKPGTTNLPVMSA